MTMQTTLDELRGLLMSGINDFTVELRREADYRSIGLAEEMLELVMPKQLKELFLLANGQFRHDASGNHSGMFFPVRYITPGLAEYYTAYGFLNGVEEMFLETMALRAHYQEIINTCGSLKGAEVKCFGPAHLHKDYMVLSTNWDVGLIAVDLAPLTGGNVGQVVAINEQPWFVAVLAPDILTYLQDLLVFFKEGKYSVIDWGGLPICTELPRHLYSVR